MALFGSKKKQAAVGGEVNPKAAPAKKTTPRADVLPVAAPLGAILRPRFTEKSSILAERSVFCFNVAQHASKEDISKAFNARYGVVPTRISIIPVRSKVVTARGRKGRTSKGRKAYIYTPSGTKIEFV